MRGAARFAVLIVVAGCDPQSVDSSLVEQVGALEVAQRRGRVEVDALERRSTQLRAELQQMEERLALARCRAIRAEVRATSARFVAQCQQQRVQYAQCNADAARSAADNTLMGGFLGLAAAALTGGAAAPLVLGGSVLGRAASDGSSECGTMPTCSTTVADYQAQAMQEHSLTSLPACRDAEEPRADSVCFFVMPTPFYLRPIEAAIDQGPSFPAHTELAIIRPGTLVRADGRRAALSRIRDGREGWVFFTENDLRTRRCVAGL